MKPYGQRSGVLNLGVEGVMLMGAFTSFWTVYKFTPEGATSYDAEALALGVLVALVVGLLMGLATAFINVTLQAEQGISGIGIYLFGLGMSDLLFQKSFNEVVLINGFPRMHIPLLSDIPVIGEIFFDHTLLVYIAFALVPITWFVMNKTTIGPEYSRRRAESRSGRRHGDQRGARALFHRDAGRGAGVAGRGVALHCTAQRLPAEHDRRDGLYRGGAGLFWRVARARGDVRGAAVQPGDGARNSRRAPLASGFPTNISRWLPTC